MAYVGSALADSLTRRLPGDGVADELKLDGRSSHHAVGGEAAAPAPGAGVGEPDDAAAGRADQPSQAIR